MWLKIPGADQTQGSAVLFLPRAYETDSFRLNAEGLDGIDDLFTEVAATVKDQV